MFFGIVGWDKVMSLGREVRRRRVLGFIINEVGEGVIGVLLYSW